MARYAVLHGEAVINVIEAEPAWAAQSGLTLRLLDADSQVCPGWRLIGDDLLPPLRNLPLERAQLWEQIKTIRDRRTREGGYQAGGYWFHSDEFSRIQQLGLVMLGLNMPQGLQWKTMSGAFVTMTPSLASAIFAAAAAADMATFAHAQALKAQVDAADDPATVAITAGWPAIYSE